MWNVATQKRKVCNMEIEIAMLVVKGSAKLTVPTDLTGTNPRSDGLCRVFDPKLRRIHLTEIILKVWVINDNTSSMYLYVKLNWDANRFLPAESKDCWIPLRKSTERYRLGAGTVCANGNADYLLENLSREHNKNLSTRDSSTFSSNQSVPSQKRVPHDLKPNICISGFHLCEGKSSL